MQDSISIVLPIYLPTDKHRIMTDKCISLAKSNTKLKAEWVIVETCSNYYEGEADTYIYECNKSSPNASINKAFSKAKGDYVVFLANDVFVDYGWLDHLLDTFYLYKDCGLASLGTEEFGQKKENKIIERVYFSVAMMRKKDAWLDRRFDNLYDDSDLIMRILTRGEKCYQNLNSIVKHLRHATYGVNDLNSPKNLEQKRLFEDKWKDYKDTKHYKLFA